MGSIPYATRCFGSISYLGSIRYTLLEKYTIRCLRSIPYATRYLRSIIYVSIPYVYTIRYTLLGKYTLLAIYIILYATRCLGSIRYTLLYTLYSIGYLSVAWFEMIKMAVAASLLSRYDRRSLHDGPLYAREAFFIFFYTEKTILPIPFKLNGI